MTLQRFPTDWRTAVVLVPHPDDPEYGIGAAVAKWTSQGRTVHYVLASRGEAGIAGMPPEEAGPLREREQRRSAAIVSVQDVTFWDFPDSAIRDTPALRAAIADALRALAPELVVTIYSGTHWAPDAPNQRDHIEFATAVAAAFDSLDSPPRWLFENGPDGTHGEEVEGFVDVAVESLAAHERYLSVLDPATPVYEQARAQVADTTRGRPEFDGRPVVEFILKRPRR